MKVAMVSQDSAGDSRKGQGSKEQRVEAGSQTMTEQEIGPPRSDLGKTARRNAAQLGLWGLHGLQQQYSG